MKRIASILLVMAASVAQAHTHLEESTPADKSSGPAPAALSLKFSDSVEIAALTLQQGNAAAQPIGHKPKLFGSNFSIPLPALADGDYTIAWKVVGDDGHPASGTIHFTVSPAKAPPPEAAHPHEHQH